MFGRAGAGLSPVCHPIGTTRDSTLQPFKGGIVKVLKRAGRRSGRAGDPDGTAPELIYE